MAVIYNARDPWTKVTALANTSKTTVYTVGDGGETSADLIGITVVDSTGSVATNPIIYATLKSGDTERVLVYQGKCGANWPLTLEGLPIHLDAGGTIAVTGASGHHVWVTISRTMPNAGRASL